MPAFGCIANSSSSSKLERNTLDQAHQLLIEAMQSQLLACESPTALAACIAKLKRRKFPSLNALTVTQAT